MISQRLPIVLNTAGTLVFAVTALYAAAVFDTRAQWTGSITALSLFTIGVFAFLWSFWNALQRSRTEVVAVSQLYLLLGSAIDRRVRWTMNSLLLAQVSVASMTTLMRPDGPDGSPGSSLAVGFLVPMFGFGMNGLWAAYHGRFDPKSAAPSTSADESARDLEIVDESNLGERIGQNAPMAETASEFTTIAASLDEIWTVVLDIERYPEWAHDVKQATIIDTDDGGRPILVDFVAAALGRSTHYSLRYDYEQAPESLSWTMETGDIQREITGSYRFSPNPGGGTDVQYDVVIELIVPLPGFVKRRAEVRILNTLKELKARVEGQ
jgi:hypothetical protein